MTAFDVCSLCSLVPNSPLDAPGRFRVAKIRREIAAHVPGSEINLARQKRTLERELRAQGYSRTAAVMIVARRFAQHEK